MKVDEKTLRNLDIARPQLESISKKVLHLSFSCC